MQHVIFAATHPDMLLLLLLRAACRLGRVLHHTARAVGCHTPRHAAAAAACRRVGRTARAGRAGWAVSFITQYDVELVSAIEGHIGHKLGELEMDEAAVLKGITRVYKAKKAAALAAMNEEDKQAVGMGRSAGSSRHKRSNGAGGGGGKRREAGSSKE